MEWKRQQYLDYMTGQHTPRPMFVELFGLLIVVRNGTQADIRRELEYKMQPMMRTGGVVFGLDHRIPNGTPIENYRFYVQTGREILGLPPHGEGSRVHHRTA